MANHDSNFPPNALNKLETGVCADIVSSLQELNQRGKPQNAEELQQRIDLYFQFCSNHDFRCGIETLCLALSVTRSAFWKWCNGERGEQWQEICLNAKQFIVGFLEQATMRGKLNPASSIFYLKNWANYRDTLSFDDVMPTSTHRAVQTPQEIAARYGVSIENTEESIAFETGG